MTRTRWTPWVTALLTGGAASACGTAIEFDTKPTNAILISLDTLRPDRLGCYGYGAPTSPTIDRVADEGVIFLRAASVSPWTLPSHATLLTGVYPHKHGVKGKEDRLNSHIPTLATLLAERGMETAAIVSSHLLSGQTGLDQGFETFHQVRMRYQDALGVWQMRNPGAEITDLALEWLHERDPSKPFFLFLHYYDAHSDYQPDEPYREMFVEEYDGPYDGKTEPLLEARIGRIPIDKRDARFLSQLYDAEIRTLDAQLKRLFERLDDSGLSRNTLVVITSDHGEEFLEHGSILHGRTYFEEVIAIPLILRGPGVPPGARSEDLTSLVDVPVTLLALMGSPAPEWMQGLDLSSRLGQTSRTPRRYVMAEADWTNTEPDSFRMLRDERHKLILDWRENRTLLYDLETDPRERHNLSRSKPQLSRELVRELQESMQPRMAPPESSELTEEALDELRKLGYGS